MTADEWPLKITGDYGDTVLVCAFHISRASESHPEITWAGPCGYSLGIMAFQFTLAELRPMIERHIALFHG